MNTDKKPCLLEYNEEQGAWHYNHGHNVVGTNGFIPMAVGSTLAIRNLANIIHNREGKGKLTLQEANDLVFQCLYDYAIVLPHVYYIPLKKQSKI